MKFKIIIIIILAVLISIIYFNNSKNEHLKITLTKDNNTKFEDLVKMYNNNESLTQLSNVQVLNKLKINNVDIKDIILNIRYPIGSYYVQYPENNTNIHDDDDIEINDMETMLPKAKSPEVLFGGKWEEKFNGESVFFRTGGEVTEDTRLNGIQPYAMKDFDGWTSIAQTNVSNPGYGAQGVLEDVEITEGSIATDGEKQDVGALIGYSFLTYLTFGIAYVAVDKQLKDEDAAQYVKNVSSTGVYAKPGDTVDARKGYYVKHRGYDTGHQNVLDPGLQSNISTIELRVRNRIMKVWKRIG